MFLCEILMDQQTFSQADDSDIDDNSELDDDGDVEAEEEQVPPFQDILPLKKYHLMQKLKNLKSRLEECNITNDDLNIILKFMNDISYDSLLSLSVNILPTIEKQLAELQSNGK